MVGSDEPKQPPDAVELAGVFHVYEVITDGETVLYVGDPTMPEKRIEHELWSTFRDCGYEVSLQQGYRGTNVPLSPSEHVLVAEPWSTAVDGVPWRNVALFVLTTLSTLFAGAFYWYQVPLLEAPWRAVEAWPFVVAIMGVLGIHEFGHYVMSRYHGVQASLPYFIPLPTYIGSMGAVIRMRGRIPSRKALFDIGVAGPLAGLVATVVVTAVGLQLEPLAVQQPAPEGEAAVRFNNPPLLGLIAELTGTGDQLETGTVHPVVFGGWVGMLVTLLNLLPVGQLDGGHILRAMVGERARAIGAVVPGALFALGGYLLIGVDGVDSVGIWLIWGLFAAGLAYGGPATPVRDNPLGWSRIAVGVLAFALGVLCFTPIPIEVIEPA